MAEVKKKMANVITAESAECILFGHRETDNLFQMNNNKQSSYSYQVLWSHERNDNIISDHIKRLPLCML